ncbi:hypothetical protein ACISOQ_07280 [Campylobacter jejuni]
MVKNLIIKFGRLILDAIAAISFVVALLYSLFMMFSIGFLAGLLSLIVSFIACLFYTPTSPRDNSGSR